MSHIRSFFTFLYDFIIGDDWTVAAAVVAALALTYWLAHLLSPSSPSFWKGWRSPSL